MMQLPQPTGWLGQLVLITLPIILAQLFMHIQNRRDRSAKDNQLGTLLKEYRLHKHDESKNSESTGPLMAENISYPRSNGR